MRSRVIDILVLGAGPYGIALATQLRRCDLDCCVVGEPMGSWHKNMPDGMFLKSEGFASNIGDPQGENTLKQFCLEHGRAYGAYGVPVPVDTFREYGRWVFDKGGFAHANGRVVDLTRDSTNFKATLDTGDEIVSRSVVVATGIEALAHVPRGLEALPLANLNHTSEFVNFSRVEGEGVVIIGGGQSALELAALLLEHGAHPRVLVREREIRWNPPPRTDRRLPERLRSPRGLLGDGVKLVTYARAGSAFRKLPYDTRVRIVRETLGPAGAWWLRERVEPHSIVHVDHRVVAAEATGEDVMLRVLTGGATKEISTRHVVAATGYRVNLEALPFLQNGLGAQVASRDGAPILSRRFESSVPGLFFIGLLAATTFGPVMRFVCGSGFAANHVSRALKLRHPV